jgi:hypothetical protein
MAQNQTIIENTKDERFIFIYKKIIYLLINKVCPEPRLSSLVGIRRQQRSLIIPHLINILNNDK